MPIMDSAFPVEFTCKWKEIISPVSKLSTPILFVFNNQESGELYRRGGEIYVFNIISVGMHQL